MLKKIIVIAFCLSFLFYTLLFVANSKAVDEFASEKRASEHQIQTAFGLEVIYDSEDSNEITVERISYNISWESPEENNTLDIFFNISSTKAGIANLTLIYSFDYLYGDRGAAFHPETFTFAEIVNGKIKNLDGAEVKLDKETVSIELNITYNQTHTYTITGELDLVPPDIVNIKSIEVEKEGIVTIDFHEVSDALGYYIYITEKKCVNAVEEIPFYTDPMYFPPFILTHLETGEEIYISISAVDMAGNINPQVDCQKFMMRMPNRSPIAKIDTLIDSYYTNQVVYFTCRETNDPDSDDKLVYSWDLDGDRREDSTDENPTYTYDTSGDYRVTLTVTDLAGLEDTNSMDITILESNSIEEPKEPDGRKGDIIVIVIVICGIVSIISLAMIVMKKRRSSDDSQDKRTGKKEKIKFLKKERDPRGSDKEEKELDEEYRTESISVEQVFKKIDVMKGFGGDEGIASENEMIKFLPMRTSVRPRKQKKKRGKGRKRRSINRSRKSPLVAAAAMEDELEGEKTTNFFTCPKCDEVLEVAISVKEGPLNERYTISCPMCNTKGDLVIE